MFLEDYSRPLHDGLPDQAAEMFFELRAISRYSDQMVAVMNDVLDIDCVTVVSGLLRRVLLRVVV